MLSIAIWRYFDCLYQAHYTIITLLLLLPLLSVRMSVMIMVMRMTTWIRGRAKARTQYEGNNDLRKQMLKNAEEL